MSIVVLILCNIHLGKVGSEKEEYIVEMMLAEEDIEEILKEIDALKSPPIESHIARNETAKPRYLEPEPLETLEELIAQSQTTSDDAFNDALADAGYENRIEALKKKRAEAKEKLIQKEAEKKEFTNNLAGKRTSISYSLVDRNSYRLPPPIYTCIQGGKVVINIKVDANGNVIEADFNEKSSSTSNGCLVDNAINYAYKARFNADSKPMQKGSITYIFQEKTR